MYSCARSQPTTQSLVLVSKRLGHSSVSMTLDIYGHLMPGWQREAAEVFAKAMECRWSAKMGRI